MATAHTAGAEYTRTATCVYMTCTVASTCKRAKVVSRRPSRLGQLHQLRKTRRSGRARITPGRARAGPLGRQSAARAKRSVVANSAQLFARWLSGRGPAHTPMISVCAQTLKLKGHHNVCRAGRLPGQKVFTSEPPSTTSTVPVMYDPASLAKSSAGPASSRGSPHRPSAVRVAKY